MLEINLERLALYSYCYRLFGKTSSIATKEDITKLYYSYSEELEKKFLNLYYWLMRNGLSLCYSYEAALKVAKKAYEDNFGSYYMGKVQYDELTTNEKLELEQFVRDNPDFMPKEVNYYQLYNMRIIDWNECNDLREASKKLHNEPEQD
jgi:hypothetical protein